MKSRPRQIVLLALLTMTSVAGASELLLNVDESPGLTTFDGLHPVTTDLVDRAWLRTPVDWFRYKKILPQKATSPYRYTPQDDQLNGIS